MGGGRERGGREREREREAEAQHMSEGRGRRRREGGRERERGGGREGGGERGRGTAVSAHELHKNLGARVNLQGVNLGLRPLPGRWSFFSCFFSLFEGILADLAARGS